MCSTRTLVIAIVVGLTFGLVSRCAEADTWTGQDKAEHIAMSAALAKLTAQTHGGVTGMALALLPGVAKEMSDLTGAGTPSVKDMAANLIGVLVGSMLPRQYMIAPLALSGAVDGVFIAYVGDLP